MALETRRRANESWHCGAEGEHTPFLVFNCALLSLSFLLGVSGNLLVCWVVFRNRALRTANNALLVNLAASDLMKCCVDTPAFLGSLLRALRCAEPEARLCCLLQFTYALCSGVQLLSLVGISVERFRAVAFPFGAEARRGRVRLWLVCIWLLGLALAAVSLSLSKDALLYMMCSHLRPHGVASPRADPFGVFVLVPVWGCCLVLIAVHYLRIFIVVRQHSNKIFDRGIQLKHSISRQVAGWHSLSKPAHRSSATLATLSSSRATGEPAQRTSATLASLSSSRATGECVGEQPPPLQEGGPVPVATPPEIVGAVCILTPAARELGQKRLEGELAKRFGCIIIAVLLFWLPLAVCLAISFSTHTPTTGEVRQRM
ncbi:hypothetical protein ACEWY4_000077 [Coilia grayii]|uniref:G-protein coupled receptors family 1 profile domain-containing protein n=1 Tax=Coilia grayii TaxID=363190 RepID=A0ABD1KVK9_9TELE